MSRVSLASALLAATAFISVPPATADAATVWSSLTHTFSKGAFADPTNPANQDRITDNVWLTRSSTQGLYNIRQENGYSSLSPAGTQWATDLNNPGEAIAATNWDNLNFTSWIDAYGGIGSRDLPSQLIGRNAVVRLITDDVYLDLRFTAWGQTFSGGGSFTYQRAEEPDTGGPKTWGVDANGNTSIASNWLGGVPPGAVDDQVAFSNIITANRTVTVDASFTAGSLAFDDNNNYTLAGPGAISLDVSTGVARIDVTNLHGSGAHTISAPLSLADSTTIDAGAGAPLGITSQITAAPGVAIVKDGAATLAVRNIRAAALSINQGALQVLPSGANDGASRVTSLTLGGLGSTMDLTNNDLVIDAGNLTEITGHLSSGKLASSSATAITTLGVILNGSQFTTFSGQSVSLDDVLVKYTYFGDANFDGRVSIADYLAADRGLARNLTGWANGDFNHDGPINGTDFMLMDQAFLGQTGPLSSSPAVAVPEPGFAALALASVTLLRRTRRRAARRAQT